MWSCVSGATTTTVPVTSTTVTGACTDGDGDGYYVFDAVNCPNGNDCDDADPNVNPGMDESFYCSDGIDNDCDGDVDTADPACQGTTTTMPSGGITIYTDVVWDSMEFSHDVLTSMWSVAGTTSGYIYGSGSSCVNCNVLLALTSETDIVNVNAANYVVDMATVTIDEGDIVLLYGGGNYGALEVHAINCYGDSVDVPSKCYLHYTVYYLSDGSGDFSSAPPLSGYATDNDRDGHFTDAPAGDSLYDPNDADSCNPDSSVPTCDAAATTTITGACNYDGVCDADETVETCPNDCAVMTTTTTIVSTLDYLIFSEVLYNTPGSDSEEEWIEIYNPTPNSVDLTGYAIEDNTLTYTFSSGVIEPHDTFVIAKDSFGFNNLQGCDPDLDGLTLSLGNSGDVLYLMDSTGYETDMVAWEGYISGWDIIANEGESIARLDFNTDTDSVSDWEVMPTPMPHPFGDPCGAATTTTITGACNYDGICDSDETAESCPNDCGAASDCNSDCNYCYNEPDCSASPFGCLWDAGTGSCSVGGGQCNHDGVCDADETMGSCPEDCTVEDTCSQLMDETTCNSQTGCGWDSQTDTCTEIAVDCPNLGETECNAQADCEWNYESNACETAGVGPGDESGLCTDGEDNDGDGLADCDDPDCETLPECYSPCDDDWSYYYQMSCTASISGTITSSDGNAVANAHVDVWNHEGGYSTMEMTDSSGAYAVDGLPDGLYYTLHVSPPSDSGLAGYDEDDIYISGALTKDIQLSAGGTITGSVTAGGVGVPNAHLDAWGPTGSGSAMTESDGNYIISGLVTDTYTVMLRLEHTDYSAYTAPEQTVSVTAGETVSGVDFVLTLGGSISGTVTYSDGTGASDIRIEAWQESDNAAGGSGHGEDWTASDGTYTLNGLPSGTYRVEARIDDPNMNYAVESQTATVTAGQETTGVNFVLASGASISGTVTDSAGSPIANADLNAWNTAGGDGSGWAMTDSDGTYTITGLSSGIYHVEVSSGSYASATTTVTVTSGQDVTGVDFVLSLGGSISGTVTYSDASPAPNLRVECWNEMGSGGGESWTESDGTYTISGLSTGTYRVEVRIDDSTANYAVDSQMVSVTAGSETSGANFVLSAGGSISGTVTDASGAVANIRVECWNEQGSGWGDAMTATDGTYTINGLSTGTYRVMVRTEEENLNYATEEQTASVTAGSATTGVDFSLTAGGSISGTVTYGGSPVANAHVECWNHEGMGWGNDWTESDGTYTITGLSSGVYEIEVRSDGTTTYASDPQTVTVVAGQETTGVNFVLSAGASISGTVTYGGSAVTNMRVECWNEQGSGWGDDETASDGTYTITGLSAGTYRVKVRNDWDPTGAAATSNYAADEIVVILTEGQQVTGIDFALTLGGTISGTVTDASGAVSHLRLEAHCENCDSWGEAMTSETGEYSITGLSTGTYRVGIHIEWGSTTNYATEEQTVSVVEGQETTGVDFALATGGSISGTVTYNGVAVANTNVGAWCESTETAGCGGGGAMTESDGTYTISGLMSGTYHVDVHSGDSGTNYASEEIIVTVTAGQAVTGVDFAMTTGGSISGTVTASGTAVANIRVECWMENGAGWGDAWTSSDGTFTITGLSTGTYHVQIRASDSDMNYASEEQVVSVTAGQETSGVNFNLSTGGSISGTVTYSGGSGASDIMVEAHKEMEHGWGNAWTASDGTYTITGLTSGTYRVEIFSDYAAQPQTVTVDTGADTSGVDFTLTTGGSISGTVTDANGAVAYITIHAWSETGGWGGSMTSSDGAYTITGLYSGIYHVNIDTWGSSTNYASEEQIVSVTTGAETSGVDFLLTAGGSISGTVKDSSGSPVPDMRVECWKEMGEGHGETMVQQDGTYQVRGLNSGIYHCIVRAQWGSTTNYATDDQTVTVTAGSDTSGVNFVLITGGSISGTVTYNSAPMLGVIVDAWSEAGWSNAMSDSDGTYTVTGLAAGTYHISAHPFWSSTGTTQNIAAEEQTVTVTAGTETSGVNFDLSDGASISGTVTLSGAGVPYVKVEAFKEEGGGWGGTMTESDGTYTITGLIGGDYFVEVRLEGTTYENYATTNQRIAISTGEAVTGIDFALESGGSISGTVTDADGAVAYLRVEAWKEGAPGWGGSMTASDGTYTIPGLSAGIYHVEVHFGWGPTGTTYTNYASEEKVVTVAAGQTTSGVDFLLTTGGSISGTVTTGGQAVQYARIEAWKEESPDWGDTWTASDGTYTLSGLTTGTYHVKVDATGSSYSGYAASEKIVSVTAGEERSGVDFSLTQGASISGTVTAGGAAAQYVRVDAWRDWESGETPDWGDTVTASDGTYTINGLMGGKYHVNIRTEDTSYASYASLEQTVTVAAGGSETGVDFALTTGGSISGTVTLSSAAVSYVRVWAWREGAPDWGDTITDDSGTYTISGLSSGSYHVGLDLMGTTYESYTANEQTVTVTAGAETSSIDFALAQGGSISGTVTDASGAVSDVHVEAWNDEDTGHGWTKTGSSGTYTITGLPAGTYNVEVHYSNYAPQMQSSVSVTAGQTTSGIDFTLAAAGAISGTVTYGGAGVADIEVFAWSPGTYAGGEALTDASGNYVIDDLPAGTYKVKPEAEGYAGTMEEDVSVTAGVNTTGVDFTLSDGGNLTGTVTDSNGTPLEEVNINIWIPGEGFGEDWEETEDDGTYLIDGIPAGTYTIEAYLEGYDDVEVNVTITDGATTTQDFTLQSVNSSMIKMASIAPGIGTSPTASAGPDQTISLGTTVYVGGDDSTDDGTIQSYAWNFADGDVVYGVTQSHIYSTPGTYTVTLTVTDDESLTGTDTLTVTVSAAAAEPTSNAGNDQTVDLDNSVSFDGSASSDSDGEIISYHWDFNDGSESTEIKPSHKYSTAGTYTVTLEITDDDGLKDTDTVTISVSAQQDPVADAGTDQTINSGESVTLDASDSYDTDGTIDAYEWKDGTDVLSTQSSFTKSDFAVGTHTITLTATDNDDNTDTDEVIITVQEGGTIVRVTPSSVSADSDESFSINITSTETDNVLGVEFVLLFNKSVLQATSVTEGDFLSSDGADTTGDAPTYSNTAGTVTFSRSRSAVDGGLTASGVIAAINFNSIADGSATLTLENVTVRDVNGTSLTLSTSNGAVTVGSVCTLLGDESPCGVVSLAEVVDYITLWSAGNAELAAVIDLITAWAT